MAVNVDDWKTFGADERGGVFSSCEWLACMYRLLMQRGGC